MLKTVRLMFMILIITILTACNNNSQETTEKPENKKVEDSQKTNEDSMDSNPIENSKKIREITPELVKDIKKILIDDASKLWPSFNNEDKQILLLNPSNKMAYLINNQKTDIGPKDEVIEYSTDSIKDTQLLVTPFQLTTFNGHPTYVFNLEFASDFISGTDEKAAYENVFKFIVHEGIHILLQSGGTVEGLGTRAETYPEDIDSRYYRNEMYQYLKKAIESKKKDEKIDQIQKAVYFYELYLNSNKKNKDQDGYDNIEGMATYLESKAYQMLKHPDASVKELNELTEQNIIDNSNQEQEEVLLMKNREFYDIGALAIASAVDLNLNDKTILTASPLGLLKSEFGSKKAEGHQNIKKANDDYYNSYNSKLKSYVDDIASKQKDNQYAAVRIPVTIQNSSAMFEVMMVEYQYKGIPAEIQTTTREIILPDTRIKLNKMKSLFIEASMEGLEDPTKMNPNTIMGYTIVFVPKKEIEFSKDKLLTIQRDDLLIFDAKYEEKDGEYQILMK
ncbi:hypothetical protein AMS59_05025 [Lysinibacillus sp. FJAT-14745]|uniref:hypothetical protein n=1 Tax=Lysinibacillus sp. FJAT-14745 TaxID=1704289 RepID=UPI0006ABB137|nr:hypothetical protein [Lysinibacillus sp. FJAT-14745]KOP80733.1 hypothetical protein AMS59_05025 [Lysinibacillus sp. FJAT-14745]